MSCGLQWEPREFWRPLCQGSKESHQQQSPAWSPVGTTNKNAQSGRSFQNPSQEGREQRADRQEMPHRLAGYSERTAGQGKLACLRVW